MVEAVRASTHRIFMEAILMLRAMPFHTIPFRQNMEKGREALEKALDFAADQSVYPLGHVSGALSPFRVDVIDTEDRYELFAELPGFHKDQISVSYDDEKYLRIRAERQEPDGAVHYLCRERRTGSFERSFEIDDLDADQVSASYEDGVLHVVLPKKKEDPNKKVFDIQ